MRFAPGDVAHFPGGHVDQPGRPPPGARVSFAGAIGVDDDFMLIGYWGLPLACMALSSSATVFSSSMKGRAKSVTKGSFTYCPRQAISMA